MVTEAQKRATQKYDKENTVQYHLKLNKNTDSDIIEFLDTLPIELGGKQGFIKGLIRDYISQSEMNGEIYTEKAGRR